MNKKYKANDVVISEIFEDELILHNIKSGETLLLNQTAMDVYKALIEGNSTSALTISLAERYGMSSDVIKPDIEKIIRELEFQNLIIEMS